MPGQKPLWLVSFAHGTTHWIKATFFIALPFLARDLGISYTQAGILVTSLYVAAFFANFVSGAAVDITGRRVLFQIMALVIGGTAIIGLAMSNQLILMSIAIAAIGISNTMWHPPALSFLSREYPRMRGYAMSVHSLCANLADAVAPLVAGILLTVLTWQGATATSAVPPLLAAIMMIALLSRDAVGISDAKANTKNGGSYRQSLVVLLRDRAVAGLAVVSGFRVMAQNGLIMFLPLYLADVMGFGPVVLGAALMAMQLGGMVAGPIAGITADRLGPRTVVMAGLSATTAIIVAITFIGNPILFVAGISLLGFALYAIRPVMQAWMMQLVPVHMGASGTSVMFGAQSLLAIATPVTGGFIADTYGLTAVFYFLAAIMLVANFGTFLLRKAGP